MTNKQTHLELTEKQKEEIDLIALQRVDAMNSDEFLCNTIDQKFIRWKNTLNPISSRVFRSI